MNDEKEISDEMSSPEADGTENAAPQPEETPKTKEKESKKQKELKAALAEAEKSIEALQAAAVESNDKYLRLAAEYDNFRRRTQKEHEGIYGDAYADALQKMLPMIDNLERAAQYTDAEKLAEGVSLILKNVPDVIASLGIEAFGDEGDTFDPAKHNAVMMVGDSGKESGSIVNVLQRGYKRGDKILRYAMVTVAE